MDENGNSSSFTSTMAGLSPILSFVTSVGNMAAQSAAMQKNMELYYENREYNTPVNQMKRLNDAGINLNAAAGGVSQNAVNSQSPPNLVPPQFNADSVNSAFANAYQARLAESQAQLFDAEAEYYRSGKKGLDIENMAKPFILANTIRNMKLQGDISEQSYNFAEENNPILLQLNSVQVLKVANEAEKVFCETENLKEQKNLIIQEVKTSKSVEDVNKALAKLHLEQIETEQSKQDLMFEQTSNESERGMQMIYDTAIKKVEAWYAGENQRIDSLRGWTPAQQSLYDKYTSIALTKGIDQANGFLKDQLKVMSWEEASISAIKYYYSDAGGSNVSAPFNMTKHSANEVDMEKNGYLHPNWK